MKLTTNIIKNGTYKVGDYYTFINSYNLPEKYTITYIRKSKSGKSIFIGLEFKFNRPELSYHNLTQKLEYTDNQLIQAINGTL